MREKYLQRLQQVQQKGHSKPLSIAGGNLKQFSAQEQNPVKQQFNSQSASLSIQRGLGLGGQASGLNSVTAYSSNKTPSISSLVRRHWQQVFERMQKTISKGSFLKENNFFFSCDKIFYRAIGIGKVVTRILAIGLVYTMWASLLF